MNLLKELEEQHKDFLAKNEDGKVELKGVENLKHSRALMDVKFKHFEALDGEGWLISENGGLGRITVLRCMTNGGVDVVEVYTNGETLVFVW